MSWLSVLPAALVAVVLLSRCTASSAAPRGLGGGGGGGGERSAKLPRAYPRLAPRARHPLDEDFALDDDEFMEAPKRTYSDYGHMRFGKRDNKFDDYGHMRFGRAEY